MGVTASAALMAFWGTRDAGKGSRLVSEVVCLLRPQGPHEAGTEEQGGSAGGGVKGSDQAGGAGGRSYKP